MSLKGLKKRICQHICCLDSLRGGDLGCEQDPAVRCELKGKDMEVVEWESEEEAWSGKWELTGLGRREGDDEGGKKLQQDEGRRQ